MRIVVGTSGSKKLFSRKLRRRLLATTNLFFLICMLFLMIILFSLVMWLDDVVIDNKISLVNQHLVVANKMKWKFLRSRGSRDRLYRRYGYNEHKSRQLSLDRELGDFRRAACKSEQARQYLQVQLPNTSVIITIEKESWSVLLRTIHSILRHSPNNLIHEVILIDNYSNLRHLTDSLLSYVRSLSPKIELLRSSVRLNANRAKMLGAQYATGNVLTFLESNLEVTKGWLEPLLYKIHLNSRSVQVPQLLAINSNSFDIFYNGFTYVAGFDWNLDIQSQYFPHRYDHSQFIFSSPVLYNGIFSIDREWFYTLAGFDDDITILDAQLLDFSMKIWLCGGSIDINVCSVVGQVSKMRTFPMYSPILFTNLAKVAEVWFGDYKKFFYENVGFSKIDIGNVDDKLLLKDSLKCHTFDWYLKNVYPELYVPPMTSLFRGRVVAYNSSKMSDMGLTYCLTCQSQSHLVPFPAVLVSPCFTPKEHQYWILTESGHLCINLECAVYNSHRRVVYLQKITSDWLKNTTNSVNSVWRYDKATFQLVHVSTNRCLQFQASDSFSLHFVKCLTKSPQQQWVWL